MDEQLVPIGRFSKATRLSIKALRHYDEIGLLVPAAVDPTTGYRYYRLGQANQAEAIRVLRGVEMPLDEIAEVLHDVDDGDRVHKVLAAHRQRLAEALDRQHEMLAFLERLLTNQESLMPYDIALDQVPDRTIGSVRFETDIPSLPGRLGAAFGAIMTAMGVAGRQPAGPPFVVYHDVIDADDEGEIEVAIPCTGEPGGTDGDVTFTTLPGGEVAATVHRGPYPQIAPAYHALTSWIAEHGHEAAGPPREIYLNDPQEVAEDDLLTRVEWPVA